MKAKINIHSAFIFFLLLFSFLSSKALGEDSLKNKFDLNDPRNPDCPCHKYQQQADKEYQQFLSINQKNLNNIQTKNVTNNKPAETNHANDPGQTIKTNSAETRVKSRHLKKMRRHRTRKQIFQGSHFGLTRLFINPTKCYSWN